MSTVGIVAALPGELKPFVRGWQPFETDRRGARAFRQTIGAHSCVAVCAGMGKEAATSACSVLCDPAHSDRGQISAFISIGWAGAISCGVKPGDAYAVAEVIDANTGERFPSSFRNNEGGRVKVVTLDHVARTDEKRRLAESYLAVLVDMEAAAVARMARARGAAFYCFKAVSDGATERMPDFNPFIENGQLQTARFGLHAAVRPYTWPGLVRLGRNSHKSAVKLAELVTGFLKGLGELSADGDDASK